MTRFLHILTVGTTAWENWKDLRLTDGDTVEQKKRKGGLKSLPGELAWWSEARQALANRLSAATADYITSQRNRGERDPYPAEVSSLVLWAAEKMQDGDQVDLLLLCSPTDEGRFSAHMLKDVVPSLPGCGSKTVCILVVQEVQGLDPRDAASFSGEGLPALGDLLWQAVLQAREDGKKPVVNLTGGYKGQIPFLTVAAMCLEGVDFIYLFHDSPSIITIPPMPIALDLVTWRDRRAILSHWGKDGIPESVVASLEPPLRQALRRERDTTGALTGRFTLNEVGSFLDRLYRGRTEDLTPHGAGKQLVERIQDSSLRQRMSDCVARWQGIWQGDRIPETVEHGRGHTQRVQELALQLLLAADLCLSDEELAILISAIWLHDIGHSGSVLSHHQNNYLVGDFPSLVRQFHHLLSRQIIEVEHGELFWKDADRWLWRGAALLAAYHRGAMPLGKRGCVQAYDRTIVKITKPLSSAVGADFNGIRLHGLGALLRVLDALDCQAERGLSKADHTGRLLASTREVQAEIGRLKHLPRAGWADSDAVKKVIARAESFGALECDEEESKARDCEREALEQHILWRLKGETGKPPMAPADGEWALLSCLDRIAFKLAQPAHYRKHATIAAAFLAPPKNGKRPITAWFVGRPGASLGEVVAIVTKEFPPEWERSGPVIDDEFDLKIDYCCKPGDNP